MFTRQAANLAQTLFLSGMPQAAVAGAQSILGQCTASLEHRGPVKLDYTRPCSRMLTQSNASACPDLPPESFPPLPIGPELAEAGDDPLNPERPKTPLPVEHDLLRPPALPGPGEGNRPPLLGEPPLPGGNHLPGEYISIDRRLRTISVNANDRRRHAAFPIDRNRPNRFHSLNYTSEVVKNDDNGDPLEISIVERLNSTQWKLIIRKLKQIDIVTDVTYSGGTISIAKKTAYVFAPEDISDGVIELNPFTFLSGAELTAAGLEFTAGTGYAFSIEAIEDVVVPAEECPAPPPE